LLGGRPLGRGRPRRGRGGGRRGHTREIAARGPHPARRRAVALLGLAASAWLAAACGGRPQVDDAGLHSAVAAARTGAEVTFDARVIDEPARVGAHEHLLVVAPTSERLEVDHNVDLAPWVPAHGGDSVVVHGQLYVDAP